MKKITIIFCFLLVASVVFAQSFEDAETRDSSQGYSVSASLVPATLTDYTLIITGSELTDPEIDTDEPAVSQNGGGDVRYSSDVDGDTQLALGLGEHITAAAPANQYAAHYVLISSLSGSSDTILYGWWETTGTSSQPAETNTYGSDYAFGSTVAAYWSLAESSDGTSGEFADLTQNDNDGTGVNTPSQVDGIVGHGQEFLGSSSERITVADSASLDFERTDAFSISMWVQFDEVGDSTNEVLISKRNSSDTGWVLYKTTGDEIELVLQGSSVSNRIRSTSTGSGISNTGWYHIVVTYSGNSAESGVRFYVNGSNITAENTQDTLSTSTLNNNTLQIGDQNDSVSFPFDGIIDEVCIWSVQIDENLVDTIYNNLTDSSFIELYSGVAAAQIY